MTNETIGHKCRTCGKTMHAGQAAVVCSVCGAAHHGDCWLVAGRCGTPGCAGVTAPPPPIMVGDPPPLLPPLPAGRPVAATVVAVILLVFAGWSLISLAVGFISMAMMEQSAAKMAEMGLHMPVIDPTPALVLAALGIAAFGASGIGLLARTSWARTTAIAVLFADWALATAGAFIAQTRQLDLINQMHERGMNPLDGRMALVFTGVTSVISLGVVLILVYVLTRPNVVEAYVAVPAGRDA